MGQDDRDYTANPSYHMVMSGFGPILLQKYFARLSA
jgi:hypothetical protein